MVNETSLYTVTTAESWADVRVLINGYEVPKTEEKVVTLTLDPGSYQVEVEYLNNWHTTEFLMNVEKQKKIYSYDEARAAVLSTGNSYDVWYVNSYNENPVLQIPNRATRPTIIVLDSYEPLQWKIVNAKANNIAYVLYHSFTPGATVTTDLESSHILPIQKDVFSNPNGYNASVQAEAQCWTDNYPPRCDNVTTISSLNDMAKSFANGALTGFTALSDSDENSAAVAIPRQSLTPATIQAIQAKNNQIKADAERQAKKESGSSVETLFDN